jgi:hypothetical protein
MQTGDYQQGITHMAEIYGAVQYCGNGPVPPPEWSPPKKLINRPFETLWILGVDPGQTTGLCLAAVPRGCIFGDEKPEFLHRESFELTGSLQNQVKEVCWFSRQVADYRAAPCLIVCEDFDLGGNRLQGAASEADVVIPVRFGAALRYAVECGHAERNRLIFQGRTIAFTTMTDDRLKKRGLWDVGSDHKRDATRHLVTALRRIREGSINPDEVWQHV